MKSSTLRNIENKKGFTYYHYKLESKIEGTINLIYTNLDMLIMAIKKNAQKGDVIKITSQNKPSWSQEISAA